MCALSMLLIISCSKKKDEPTPTPEEPKLPTIEFVNAGENYVYQDTEVISGSLVGFQLRAVATDSKDLLTSIEFKVIFNNETMGDSIIALDNEPSYVFTVEPTEMDVPSGILTIEATTTTKGEKTATAKVNITVVEAELEVEDLEWVRAGGTPGTGLEQFGLEWKSNAKEVKAKIVPVEGAVLKTLEGVEFGAITTEMAKIAAFETTATPAEKFHEVSCEASHDDYNFVIMTQYNENIYLINITKGTVENGAAGTTVTINGQWK